MSVEIQSRNVGRLIGPRGATIKDLQMEFNVNISISKEDNGDGNRIADITGSDADVQRAIQVIQERFGNRDGGGGGGYRGDSNRSFNRDRPSYGGGNNRDRSQTNFQSRRQNDGDDWDNTGSTFKSHNPMPVQQNDDGDDWDNATPAFPTKQASGDWENDDAKPCAHQPSANSYQRSYEPSSTSFDPPKRFNRDSGSQDSRSRGSNNFYSQGESRSSYSSGNKIPYRNFDNAQTSEPTSTTTGDDHPIIDWDKANAEAEEARIARWAKCPLLIKDFYVEHPEVTEMKDEDVEKFRIENKNIVVARTFAKEEESTDPMPKPTTKFEHAFEKFPDLMTEIKKAGFEKPSPIQSQMWPILMAGEDCIGIAQTGTGKTLAFLLPALIHTDGQPHARGIQARGGPNVLVLAPTRELAIQIEKEVAKYQFRGIRAVCLYGGNDRKKQIEVVESGVEIIIATPGRLNDLVSAGHIKIESITYLILDEADRMLDMGFEPQIRKLLLDIRSDRQTVMTSATWPAGVRRLAGSYMSNPYQVFIGSLDLAAVHTVTQVVEIMDEEEKFHRVLRFAKVEMLPTDKAIIFCGKKDRADSLSCEFVLEGISCQSIHGNRDQSDREQALADIKSGEVSILIATDVASRGIDIEDITYVVNYDFPRNIEEYVHRVGRTGRANRTGTSLSFMTRSDWGSAAELIEILKEADQEVLPQLQDMADRFKAKKEREKLEGGGRGGGFRGGRGRGGGGGGFCGGGGGFGGGFGGGGYGGGNNRGNRGGSRW